MTDEPGGLQGELINRLLDAVDSPHGTDWLELSHFLVFAVGGTTLWSVTPDTGRTPTPGSLGERIQQTHHVVDRETYFRLIQARLMELVRSGVREDFLIRGLRDELTWQTREYAQTEAANTRREESRARIERHADDADFIGQFRSMIAKDDPEAVQLTDEQIANRLRDLVSHLQPMTRDAEREAWLRSERWNERVSAIDDATLSLWLDRYAKRVTLDSRQ